MKGLEAYCKAATPESRELASTEIGKQLSEKGLGVCLSCAPGEAPVCSGTLKQ